MSNEFLVKLKETLQLLDSRISALEHIVNDVIITGLQNAADEYADDEAYSLFCDTYGEGYKDLIEPSKVMYGNDYDLSSDLYETIKATDKPEGFDEKAEVERLIQILRDKVDSLRGKNKAAAKEAEEAADEAEEVIDEAELRRIYRGE